MHRHPLHRNVDVQCLCCHLVSRFHFTSSSDQVICKGCLRHQGSSAAFYKLRDRDHLQLWKSELDLAREDHQEAAEFLDSRRREAEAQVRRLSEELSDLRATLKAEIGQRPVATVAHWFEADTVREALAQRDSAFRVRDRVMQSLWRVDELHHTDEDNESSCSCGRPTRRCDEWLAMTDLRPALDKWERTQRERMFDGLEHSLPEDHPHAMGAIVNTCGSMVLGRRLDVWRDGLLIF